MNILNIFGANITLLIIGYLVGSFCFGIILSKLIFKKDLRQFGSKNSGATNMNRVFGFKWAALVWFLDFSKIIVVSIISFFLIRYVTWFQGNAIYLIAAFGGLIGHSFPLYFKFKGGKIVSSFMGLLVSFSLFLFLLGLFFFTLTWLWSKKIGKSSVIFAIVVLLTCWLPWFTKSSYFWINSLFNTTDYYLNYPGYFANTTLIALGSILLIILHHQNIKNEFKTIQKIINHRKECRNIKLETIKAKINSEDNVIKKAKKIANAESEEKNIEKIL
ncbi:glycerol-3-phosphate acyltransferase [Mycoplasma sp. SG1]|uniref:glycerol-3-phosphate acyltransferase n=1 Tax=Mycoplasma sp. SG1 TaxID=2810348 RepID=UPI002024FED6|nr:glycerol-3-phosphate acyltransferase [Mycoplasma sp. SG1]URM53069.1 glycerol-3-phosphate acyltransferase [Mycoplasma sp. SG1]